jgi:hypothetical protein
VIVFNRIAVVFALIIAALGSQIPEFAQQYRQRLGGAIDELNRIIVDFDNDAAKGGLNDAQAIASLEANADPFVRGRGVQMHQIELRRDRLQRQLQDLETPAPLGEIVALAENFDGNVATNVLSNFNPAVPVTLDGLFSAILGFAVGFSALHLCAWPIRHHYRRRRMVREGRDPVLPAR